MMGLSVSIEIDRPIANVWAVITDIENAENMISGIMSLKILDKPEEGLIGLKWQETRKMFGKEASEVMWITEAVPEEYYCTRAESHGSVYLTRMSVKEVESHKTELTMFFFGEAQSTFVKIISKIMGLFVTKSMKKLLLEDLQDIKKYIEATD